MDIKDDKKIGVKSTSILIEHKMPLIWLMSSYVIFGSGLLLAFFLAQKIVNLLDLMALALCIIHLAWQIFSLDIEDPADCLKKFKSNMILGLLIFIVFI